MNIWTFTEDLLDLHDFSDRLERFIETELDFVEGSLVVALSSKFGSGKTTFLRMWQTALEAAPEAEGKPLVISLNAWESDYYGDPLFAIISALAETIQRKDQESAEKLRGKAKRLGQLTVTMGSQLLNKHIGIDPIAANKIVEAKQTEHAEFRRGIPDTFTRYEDRKRAMASLKGEIDEFVSSKHRVLFLVDELDRCRPDYAITYLETIKHIFDIKGTVFLLAADRKQLENSAKTAFGSDLDFEEYYRRFVHREVTLPPISDAGYGKLAEKYVNWYLEREGSRFCFMKLDSYRVENIRELIVGLKLTPRQIQEVFRILGHLFAVPEHKRGQLRWCIAVGSIAMAAFKVGKPDFFCALGGGRLDPKAVADFLSHTVGSDVEWWFILFLTGEGLLTKKGETMKEIAMRAGFTESESPHLHNDHNLHQWNQGWGYSTNCFKQIYDKIQQISQWD
uniref:KAP family P-loop domain-containing protein n=1 Tax=Candidatus Kentrum sp. TUN TaxID=2126343 RepID=A0A450ZAY2_9GAMM|nr:MAG: KAP family P-loop domain-containing protein [Candidatus Kentron sp. TUN]VFK52115.1 MAG: KAP family P-loop domain-containing protein [Candidatus Kentron sp. TUN]VFK52157.1 MAG: KAP family P-loop domain-containing protein [Candidatus Kentron sp. TUN]